MSGTTFNPEDIPSLQGRVYFITGGTAGLGAGTIKLLAAKGPAHIFFSGRNQQRADELIAEVKKINPAVQVTFINCDLSSLSSVQQCAQSFLSMTDRLDVLYANAGVMGNLPGTTKDGYEIQFGVNHLGHALLIKLLLPILQRTVEQPNSDVRIINMASVAHKYAPKEGIVFETLKTDQRDLGGVAGGIVPGHRWGRYGQSKLANLLYARELAKRYPSIMTVAIHPGYVKTDLFDNIPFRMTLPQRLTNNFGEGWTPLEEGPHNQTWAGTTARSDLENGVYYTPVGHKAKLTTSTARDDGLSARLWDWTEKELASFV